MEHDITFKALLLGDPGVGKSSILSNYIKRDFKAEHNATVGVEFGSKLLEFDNQKIKLQIWDTAGQESFRSIIRSFYRDAAIVYLVYNVCRRDSFDKLDSWIEELNQNAVTTAVLILIGNQADKEEERKVEFSEGERFARDKKFELFLETSAFRGDNIDKCFYEGTKRAFESYQKEQVNRKVHRLEGSIERPATVNLADHRRSYSRLSNNKPTSLPIEEKQKSGCCGS